MTIFNITGGGSGGDGSPTFKEMTTGLYEIKADDWGNHYTSLPDYFFSQDTLLQKITLPSNITQIGTNCFEGATALKDVTLPDTITSIGTTAFKNTHIESFVIPPLITIINSSTFRGCTLLENITISLNVASMNQYALRSVGTNTTNGITIRMLPTTPPTITNNILNDARINKIIVPQGTLTTYQTATNWSAYAQYMEEAT